MVAGKMSKVSRGRRTRRFKRKKKSTLSKRVSRLENSREKKFDIYLLSNLGDPNIPNYQEMTNNIGTAATGYDLQVRNITPIILQGDNDNERIGDQVDLKSIDFRCVCKYQPTVALPYPGSVGNGDVAHCRVMLVWDNNPTHQGPTNPSTGVPSVEENPLSWNHVLSLNPAVTTTPAVAISTYNHDIVDRDHRISVLLDKRFSMVAGTDRSVVMFNLKKNYIQQKFKYLLGQNTVLNRHLKLLFYSNRPSGECPQIYMESECIYTDP